MSVLVLRKPVVLPYSTTFPLTESPMVEDGGWDQGNVVSGYYLNVNTANGRAFGTGVAANYEDGVALRKVGQFSPTSHYSWGKLHKKAAYTHDEGQECELLTGFTMDATRARGYENLFSLNAFYQVVRWDGATSHDQFTVNFNTSINHNGGIATPALDDEFLVVYNSFSDHVQLLTYQNDVLKVEILDTDAPWSVSAPGRHVDGVPGMGFFARAGAGLEMDAYCWKDWRGGNN